MVDLDPVRGHEQAGRRPALIVSSDDFNTSPAELVSVLPVTSRHRKLPSRVRITPPEGGLTVESWVICEQVRTISKKRCSRHLGQVAPATMQAVSDIVRLLLHL
jgi:mRNA interferase MazF